jgi:4-hydroxy-tetrahydrodipicolinate synthase
MSTLNGIYAAVASFDAARRPDSDQFQKLLRHLEARGCHGVLIAGTTGEGPSLSVDERIALVKAAVTANSSLRLLAGTGATSLEDAIALARAAFDAGAAGIVVIPPFFYARPSVSGLIDFYARLIEAAVPADGAVLLYHNPTVSAPPIEPELVARLVERFPEQVVGIKDSSGDFAYTESLLDTFPGFRVFVGDDRLLARALAAGAAGAITALAGVFPDLARAVFDHYYAGEPIDQAQERLSLAHSQIADMPRIATVKWLLAAGRVLEGDAVRPPLTQLSEDQINSLRSREWR